MRNKKPIFIVIVAVILLGILYVKFGMKLGSKHFKTYEEFKSYAFTRTDIGLPEGAEDPEFYFTNELSDYCSIYAFTLKGNDYKKFISAQAVRKNTEWYGKSVSEVLAADSELSGSIPFNEVINDSIYNFEFIEYSPIGAGKHGSGIAVNPNTGRVVVFTQGRSF